MIFPALSVKRMSWNERVTRQRTTANGSENGDRVGDGASVSRRRDGDKDRADRRLKGSWRRKRDDCL